MEKAIVIEGLIADQIKELSIDIHNKNKIIEDSKKTIDGAKKDIEVAMERKFSNLEKLEALVKKLIESTPS